MSLPREFEERMRADLKSWPTINPPEENATWDNVYIRGAQALWDYLEQNSEQSEFEQPNWSRTIGAMSARIKELERAYRLEREFRLSKEIGLSPEAIDNLIDAEIAKLGRE